MFSRSPLEELLRKRYLIIITKSPEIDDNYKMELRFSNVGILELIHVIFPILHDEKYDLQVLAEYNPYNNLHNKPKLLEELSFKYRNMNVKH